MAIEKRTGNEAPRPVLGKTAKSQRVVRFVDLNDSLDKVQEYTEGTFVQLPAQPSNGDALTYNAATNSWEAGSVGGSTNEVLFAKVDASTATPTIEVYQNSITDATGEITQVAVNLGAIGSVELILSNIKESKNITVSSITAVENSFNPLLLTTSISSPKSGDGDVLIGVGASGITGVAAAAQFTIKLEVVEII